MTDRLSRWFSLRPSAEARRWSMALALTASATILFDTAQLFVHVMTGRVVPAPYFEWLAVTPFSAGSATTVSPLVS